MFYLKLLPKVKSNVTQESSDCFPSCCCEISVVRLFGPTPMSAMSASISHCSCSGWSEVICETSFSFGCWLQLIIDESSRGGCFTLIHWRPCHEAPGWIEKSKCELDVAPALIFFWSFPSCPCDIVVTLSCWLQNKYSSYTYLRNCVLPPESGGCTLIQVYLSLVLFFLFLLVTGTRMSILM